MPGWLFRVVIKRDGGTQLASPIIETYIANIADQAQAWTAVAAEVNKIDPLATAKVVGVASDERLAAEQVPAGEIRLSRRTS